MLARRDRLVKACHAQNYPIAEFTVRVLISTPFRSWVAGLSEHTSRVIRLAYVVLTVIARFWCAATSYGAGKPRCALNSPPPVIGFSYYPAG